jgi:S1-C subfamily serine protease
MLRITHTRGRMAPAVEHFASQRLRVGSAPGSDLLFAAGDDRSGVAPQHAEIRWERDAWQVLDLGAPAGTFVNRARVAKKALRSGDLLTLGRDGPEFRVEMVQAAPSLADIPAGSDGSRGARGSNGYGAPDSEGRVDLATAERLVTEAVMRVTTGEDKTNAIVAARMKALGKRATRNNRILSAGLALTFVALVATSLAIFQSQRRAGALASEAGLDRNADSASKLKGQLPTHVMTGREIYEENRAAVYLIGWLSGNKVGGLCTAFAIQPSVLATNAHCVNAYKEKGGTPVVTQNDSGGKVRFRILAAAIHPGYKPGRTSADAPDVGLLRVDGKMPKIVTLANDAELHSLGPGDDMFVLGFPGRVMDPISPSATFLQGHLGRLMALGEQAAESLDDAVLVQHDAVTRGGNSGSPIFDQFGHVIAIHAAHLDDEDEVQVGGKQTTVVNASPFRVGMRIDLLRKVRTP